MKAALIQILMGAIGTLGFSIYFRVSERNVAAATFGGALGWGVYLLCFHLWGNVFAANVVATAVVYFWSVAMARVLKAPSNTYLIPGIIPLLPGGPLYYTMAGLVDGDRALFIKNGTTTILVTFGMVTGMVAAAVVFYYILKLQQKCSRKSPAPPQDLKQTAIQKIAPYGSNRKGLLCCSDQSAAGAAGCSCLSLSAGESKVNAPSL